MPLNLGMHVSGIPENYVLLCMQLPIINFFMQLPIIIAEMLYNTHVF